MKQITALQKSLSCKSNLTILSLLGLITLLAGGVTAASFDCAKASTQTERAICQNPSVSKLDEELAVAYKNAGPEYRDSQRAWLRKRNQCGANANCLFIEYQSRIKFLKAQVKGKQSPSNNAIQTNSQRPRTRANNPDMCFKYDWGPVMDWRNNHDENAAIVVRGIPAATCVGFMIAGIERFSKDWSAEKSRFYKTEVARAAEFIEKELCAPRELTIDYGYEKNFEFGRSLFNGHFMQFSTGTMKEAELSARMTACKAVTEHYMEQRRKYSQ